jgi:hypothetical protein
MGRRVSRRRYCGITAAVFARPCGQNCGQLSLTWSGTAEKSSKGKPGVVLEIGRERGLVYLLELSASTD